MTPLEKSIIATISYFDIFDYPLTLMEIWEWLLVYPELIIGNQERRIGNSEPVGLNEVQQALVESDYLRTRLETENGFYFLPGRADIIGTRLERYSLAEKKYHRAKRIMRWIRFFPFVKMIGVCNTLAYNNSRRDADIDFFIITKPQRVWQARFWVTGFLKLLGLRPSPGATRDRICASFFVDEDHLNLETLSIREIREDAAIHQDDIYLLYWVTQVVPVYDEDVYRAFLEANQWVRQRLPNFLPIRPAARRLVKYSMFLKKIINFIAYFLPENFFKKYQLKIMPAELKNQANKGSRVVIRDYMLKFHDNDRRQLFLEKWRERMRQCLY